MKANSVNHPYILDKYGVAKTWRFALDYVPLSSFIPRVQRLYAIHNQPSPQREDALRAVIAEKERSSSFDISCLEDLSEKPLIELRSEELTPLVQNPGIFVVTNANIYFQPFNNILPTAVFKYPLNTIKRVLKRRYLLRQIGLEFFFADGNELLFTFACERDRNRVWSHMMNHPDVPASRPADPTQIMADWVKGNISNFDYLMFLNSLADRTFNDLTQYPVFPWVLADYNSTRLDLTRPETFRDLTKPIGALNADRLALLKARYDDMPPPKFLYGTHYSTPGYVLFYLVRQAPECMLRLQDGRFDAPDRLFTSIERAWRGVLANQADLKELIPQFYMSPGDFLYNTHNLDLGALQSGQKVDAVELPPWALDAHDFTTQMRAALECEYVSRQLHHWVDLIFGYKQRGETSVRANNVFYYLTYENAVDLDNISDPIERASIIAQIREFGQTPKQLFTKPHPARLSGIACPTGLRGIEQFGWTLGPEWADPPAEPVRSIESSSTAHNAYRRASLSSSSTSSSSSFSSLSSAAASSPMSTHTPSSNPARGERRRPQEERPSAPVVACDAPSPANACFASGHPSPPSRYTLRPCASHQTPKASIPGSSPSTSPCSSPCTTPPRTPPPSRGMASAAKRLQSVSTLKMHRGPVTALQATTDLTTLFSVSKDATLKIYSLADMHQIRTVSLGDLTLSSCSVGGDGKTVAVGSWDNSVYLYDMEYGQTRQFMAHDDAVSCLARPRQRDLRHFLFSASWDASCKVWDLEHLSGENPLPAGEFSEHECDVSCLAVHPAGTLFVSGDTEGYFNIYDVQAQMVTASSHLFSAAVTSSCFSADGTRVAVSSADGLVRVLDAHSAVEVLCFHSPSAVRSLVTDGATLCAGCADGSIGFWDLSNCSKIRGLSAHSAQINCVELDAHAQCLMSGGADCAIRIFRTP